MEINEIYEIKDMYDVKILLSKYLDFFEFIKCASESDAFDKEQLKALIDLIKEHTILYMYSLNDSISEKVIK